MPFLGRARYNLLRIKYEEDRDLAVQSWQIRDYRTMETKEIFIELKKLGLELSKKSFESIADEYESPEELINNLPKELYSSKKPIYLLIFELWRRLLKDRMTISIFCDELDFLLSAYERDPEQYDERVQNALVELIDILDANVDTGQKPRAVFKRLSSHSAHDLEHFIYNYIFEQIEKGNETLASEMLGDFYDYVKETSWFDFLRIKLLKGSLIEEATLMLARFADLLKEKKDLDLYFEFLHYLIEIDHQSLFLETYKYVTKLIKTEEQYLGMLDILLEFYSLNDLEKEEKTIRKHVEDRREIPFHKKISKEDKDWLGLLH